MCVLRMGLPGADDGDFCPICQFPFLASEPVAITACCHSYHAMCLAQAQDPRRNLAGVCAVCRSPLVPEPLSQGP